MYRKHLAWLIPMLFWAFFLPKRSGATPLGPGDVAFSVVNSDFNNTFSFVFLRNVSDSTGFYITDNGWDGANDDWYNLTEGILKWTYNGSLPCGTEVLINPINMTASVGTITIVDGVFNSISAGDGLLMYEGSNGNTVTSWITGFNFDADGWNPTPADDSDSDLPAALTEGVTAMATDIHADNWQFDCSSTTSASLFYGSALYDITNWNSNNIDTFAPIGCMPSCESSSNLPNVAGASYTVQFNGANEEIAFDDPLIDTSSFTVSTWFELQSLPGAGQRGIFDGSLLPRASYYWIIDLQDGINEPFKGIISVIK